MATPAMEMTASAVPRKCEPESPMKMRAGAKLKRRKPPHTPARPAASCTTSVWCVPAAAKTRVTATMSTTPAASPSTPSRKLTVFCMPMIQNRLIGTASQPSCTTPADGRLTNVIWNSLPNASTAISAMRSCSPNLLRGGSDHLSSAIRRMAASADTISTPTTSNRSFRATSGRVKAMAMAKPANIAMPPSSGMGLACTWRSLGCAITPRRRESQIMSGTRAAVVANASSIGHRPGRRWSRIAISEVTLKKSDSDDDLEAART